MPSLREVFHLVLESLEGAGIEYAVIGGLSLPAYGHDRTTRDVDLTVGLGRENCHRLKKVLGVRGLLVHEKPFALGPFLDHRAVVLEGPGFVIDLLLQSNEFQSEVLSRKQAHRIFGREVWVASLEDVLVYKLLTRRLQDALDFRRLRELNPGADLARVRAWARSFSVEDRLDALLRADLAGWDA